MEIDMTILCVGICGFIAGWLMRGNNKTYH